MIGRHKRVMLHIMLYKKDHEKLRQIKEETGIPINQLIRTAIRREAYIPELTTAKLKRWRAQHETD